MPDLNELLKQYGEACVAINQTTTKAFSSDKAFEAALGERKAQQAALFAQITSLFADSARVERNAITQLVKAEVQGSTARRIIKAIEARDK